MVDPNPAPVASPEKTPPKTADQKPSIKERPAKPSSSFLKAKLAHFPPALRLSRKTAVIALAAAAALLAAAAGVWVWRMHGEQSSQSRRKAVSSTQSEQSSGLQAMPVAKPAAGVPLPPNAGKYQSQPGSAANLSSGHPSLKPSRGYEQDPKTPTPAAPPAPTPAAFPSAPFTPPSEQRSGILHYAGPPVPYNGEVTFDHLPQGRLKFTFDHQAWSLTIKVNPDGSKRITLFSRVQGYQFACDVRWEFVQ